MTTTGALRRRTVLAMAVSAAALSGLGPIGAARADIWGDPLNSNLADLKVVDRETGQPLEVWRHDGRLFVAGQPGARYSLRVTNRTDGRLLVVLSVDGVNVITGETAGYNQRGYVIAPHQSYDVSGWRKSDSEVAAFTFAPLPQSYAARTGRPADVGVIGLAAFRERAPPPAPAITPLEARRAGPNGVAETIVGGQRAIPAPPAPLPPSPRAPPAPGAALAAEPRADKLGTAHGAREYSFVTNVAFQRATAWPQLIQRIEYDSLDNLVAQGVVRPPAPIGRWPRPFPTEPGRGYVPDPPGGR